MEGADDVSHCFKHEPLDTRRQQIRLVCITPASSGDIKCQLRNAYLEDDRTPDYRAVSYEWGPSSPLRRIYIDGQPLRVRQNLYAFLETFRTRLFKFQSNSIYEAETQWLWIDQICINQTVITERNHQVRLMSEIYSRAAYVYVWLGPCHSEVEAAMTVLKSGLRRYYEDRTTLSPTKGPRRRRISGTEEQCDPNKKPYSEPKSSSLPAAALRCFFLNTYWKRLWIVQEIMLARYIRIMCGETILSWEELRRFCLSSASPLLAQVRYCIPQQVIWLVEHALSAKKYTYTSLLATFSKSGCHDPKDKVYGLQGLVASRFRVEVDYARSIQRVFLGALDLLYEREGHAAQVQVGGGLERIDYSDPTKAMLQVSSILNDQMEVNTRIPLVTALVELGNQMGFPLVRMYATCIGGAIQKRAKSLWSQLISYYLQERIPSLYIRRQLIYDEKEFHNGRYDPSGLIRDVWETYEELEYVHGRFIHWIECDNHTEQYVSQSC